MPNVMVVAKAAAADVVATLGRVMSCRVHS